MMIFERPSGRNVQIRVQRDGFYFIYVWKWIISNSDNPLGYNKKYIKPPIKTIFGKLKKNQG